MSAWVVALGLGAGYLINKNTIIQNQLETSADEFNSAAKPATGGVTSEEVRKAHRRIDYVKYGDMNTDLLKRQKDALLEKASAAEEQAERFDSGPLSQQIQGVLMVYDHLGV